MITGYKDSKCISIPSVDHNYVNDLNPSLHVLKTVALRMRSQFKELYEECVVVEEHEMCNEFERVDANKTCGPGSFER